jgi:ribosome-associated protein
MIRISPSISLNEDEIKEEFVRSSGPGGQNVNKVATAVQLRFDAANSPSLSPGVRRRLISLAGSRATSKGVIVITARRHRHRERNRLDALERLKALILQAAQRPRPRRRTRPSPAALARRRKERRLQAEKKRRRRPVSREET